MQFDITAALELDIPETGLDLAKLVFDVARECNSTGGYSRSIDFSGLLDDILIQIAIVKAQQNNPNLSEDEKQNIIDTITAENNRKKEELAAARAAKREKVKQLIHGNASEGYELAYNICKGDKSDEAKELSYCLISYLENLSIEEKLEISRLYVESLLALGKGGNDVADIYCEMGRLACPENKRGDYSLSLNFYEKAYENINERTWRLNEIVAFCNRFGLEELREKCEQKKAFLQSLPPKTIDDLISKHL